MRILFAGSPDIAVPVLEKLFSLASLPAASSGSANVELVAILTNPDTAQGRSSKLKPTEIAAAAESIIGSPQWRGITPQILKPEKLDSAVRDNITLLKPDLLVSFAYGKIFGPRFLSLFPLGGINIHPSLLPKYRGPTPIPAAIINRNTMTGITIQKLAAEMDSGDILVQEIVPLDGSETTLSLSETMAQKAAVLLPGLLDEISAGTVQAREQDHASATYCSLIEKKDGIINWNLSAAEIDAQIRAYTPWPLCWTKHGELELYILKATPHSSLLIPNSSLTPHSSFLIPHSPGRVLGKDNNKGILIQTGDGILVVSELQYRSKKALEWKAFLNGARNFIETQLG